MSTSDVINTSDEESGQGSSDDSEDERKVKKKGKKKKIKKWYDSEGKRCHNQSKG